MDEVIVFDKTFQQRFEEYKEVFAGNAILPVSDIQKQWSFYLELTLDPNGWQAIWKIQRKTCEELNIPFPSIALVFVLSLDFEELTAFVKVLAVKDDIHIPDKHHVALKQIWPTKHQDKSIFLNLHSTANSLDMLRFFYNNVLMPWDHDDDDKMDWKESHLESRLRLYYDMKNGVIPRSAGQHLQSLISNAKRMYGLREEIESRLEDLEYQGAAEINHTDVQELKKIHIQLTKIKTEVDILENRFLRDVYLEKYQHIGLKAAGTEPAIWVIMNNITAKNSIDFLSKIEEIVPEKTLQISPELSSALENGNVNDLFFLSATTHNLESFGTLEFGGTLKSISSRDSVIIVSDVKDVMLDFRGENAVIENLTIDASNPQCGILICRGHLTLKNCKLIGDGKSSTHQGIIVLSGAKLEIVDSEISKFYTGVVGNSGSSISIDNSEIYDCNFGVKIFDECALTATNATVRNCLDYGVYLETDSNFDEVATVGDFATLNVIPKVRMDCMRGSGNLKGDAVISQKPKLTPVEDLFGDPNQDPTIYEDSDDEMEAGNVTVIENSMSSPTSV